VAAFHEKLAVAFIEYERPDGGGVGSSRILGKLQRDSPRIDDPGRRGAA